MTDDELLAAAKAYRGWLLSDDRPVLDEYMFAAGIAYAQTWRSMESAPRDGTVILLGNQHGSWIAQWVESYPSGYRAREWFSLMLNRDYIKVGKYAPPTHWMPLPLPPTEGK